LYVLWIVLLNVAISNGRTNASSWELNVSTLTNTWTTTTNIIPSWLRQVHRYLSLHPEDTNDIVNIYKISIAEWWWDWLPDNNWWLDFIIKWFNNRKTFVSELKNQSKLLWLDYDLVLACVLWEQTRIANKWARWNLKDIVMYGTRTLFRSYDTSLWLGGIKVTTANQIKRDAVRYWYGTWLLNDSITSDWLIHNDKLNAKYATYLVKNIITRRQLSWYDISNQPWVVCTLYNMGNDIRKQPNPNPKIGGSIIHIWNRDYYYWEISAIIYWYIKIYLNNN